MTLLQRVIHDAKIREADLAFLQAMRIVPNLEPTEEAKQENECPRI
jgi:hypothetical protein